MMFLLPAISFFTSIIYFYFGLFVIIQNKNVRHHRLFFLVTAVCTFWSFCIAVFHLVQDKSIAKNIYFTSLAAPFLLPSIMVHFTLIYTNKILIFKKKWLPFVLYIPAGLIYAGIFIPDIIVHDLVPTPYGWIIDGNETSIFVWFFISYFFIYNCMILVLLIKWKKESVIEAKKNQADIFILFLILSALFVIGEEFLCRFLKIQQFPTLAHTAPLIWLFGVFFVIKKYKLMKISPEYAVHEILFNMMDILILTGNNGEIIQINQQLTHLLGFTEKDLTGKPVRILFEDNLDLSGVRTLTQSRKKVKTTKGIAIPVILRITPIKNKDMDILGYLFIGHDAREREELESEILERENAEKSLVESQSLYISTINAMDEMIHVVDRNLRIILCNETFLIVAKGFNKRITIGKTKLSDIFSFLRDEVYSEYKQVFETGRPFISHEQNEIGGGIFYTETRKIPVFKNHRVSSVVTIVRDITEKKKIEQAQLQSSIADSMSLLASGIAHDYNNLLTTILGNITLAKNYFSHKALHNEALAEAEAAGLQAKDLTQQLFTFSQKGTLEKKEGDICMLLKKSTSFFLSGSNIKCKFLIPDNLYKTSFDKQQIARVFQNLLLNAKQAMPAGGTLYIRMQNRIMEEQPDALLSPGKYIEICFIDQGNGINDEILSRIFNPYFTTKESGSGLGLATAYSIVKRHGGTIEVFTKPGEGSTFTVCLPANESMTEGKARKKTGILKKGKGKILVMDDDKHVRETLKRILEHLGYSVVDAENGDQAISLYTRAMESGSKFDLVILDFTIQGGENGGQIFKNLHRYDPFINAVIYSGYGVNENFSNLMQLGLKGFVKKPFDVIELSELLEKIIKPQV